MFPFQLCPMAERSPRDLASPAAPGSHFHSRMDYVLFSISMKPKEAVLAEVALATQQLHTDMPDYETQIDGRMGVFAVAVKRYDDHEFCECIADAFRNDLVRVCGTLRDEYSDMTGKTI